MPKRRLTHPDAVELARLREQKGWTQEALAERAGCSLRTVQRAEHGDALRPNIIAELAGALECHPEDISLEPASSSSRHARGYRNSLKWATLTSAILFTITIAVVVLAWRAPRAGSMPRLVGIPLVGDVDGDGRDDLLIWEPSTGQWHGRHADGRTAFPKGDPILGLAGDIPLTAKLSHSRAVALVIWRPALGKWYAIWPNGESAFPLDHAPALGRAGDEALTADLDGSGTDELVNWHPADASSWSAVAPDGTVVLSDFSWGRAGDEPILGDFDGDGSSDLGIWRPSTGHWFASTRMELGILFRRVLWGKPGDVALLGDFDGDGRSDLTSWTPSTGEWSARSAPSSEATQNDPPDVLLASLILGQPGDHPLTGDFDGDGRDDLCVWRPADGVWLGVDVNAKRLFRIKMRH